MIILTILKVIAFVLIFFWLISLTEKEKPDEKPSRKYKDE